MARKGRATIRRLLAAQGLVERGPIPTTKRKPKSEKAAGS
jgi:hypothetical protein